jgi:hypothetical protein
LRVSGDRCFSEASSALSLFTVREMASFEEEQRLATKSRLKSVVCSACKKQQQQDRHKGQ